MHDDYDPAGARRLLAGLRMADRDEDGVLEDSGGHPVTFSLKTNNGNAGQSGMATFVRDDLAKVGIAVTLVPIDFNALVTDYTVSFDYDAAILGSSVDRPDPSRSAVTWRSNGNAHRWNPRQPHPETPEEAHVDQLLDRLATTGSIEARKAVWKEVQDYVNEQAWLIWLPTEIQKIPIRNRFGNLYPTSALSGASAIFWNAPQIFVKSR